MECNKEEAIRAKAMAEGKMRTNDFNSARKLALKAKQLFPELENISQLLAVCEVHFSAQSSILGSEKDWYGILQIERVADETTIKKQYRKLALLLHPDKNKFPGAEAAFKLIGEANRVLTDQTKRSLYDSKLRGFVGTSMPEPPSQPVSRSFPVNKTAIPTPHFAGMTQHTQHGFASSSGTFWTCCPYCYLRYQFQRVMVNKNIRCQACLKSFTAYETGPQGLQPDSSLRRPTAFQAAPRNMGVPPPPFTFRGFQGTSNHGSNNFTTGCGSAAMAGSSATNVRGSKNNVNGGGTVDTGCQKKGAQPLKSDASKQGGSNPPRNNRMKRGRKMVVESSESSESSNDVEESMGVSENNGLDAGLNGGNNWRRSSRLKRNVSYNERGCDDDDELTSPLKRSKDSGSSEVTEETEEVKVAKGSDVEQGKDEFKPEVGSSVGGSSFNENQKAKDEVQGGTERAGVDLNGEKTDVDESGGGYPITYDYPDPEFTDFDKMRAEECFGVDQLWAVYDTIDGMPRFYALVRRVFSSAFKLRITWLEPDPDDEAETEWKAGELPYACGKFSHGTSEVNSDRLMFSHQVFFRKGKNRRLFVIYPQVGETWALFQSWDINWRSNPDGQRPPYRFEFVEILSQFNVNDGIKVGPLKRVEGFVSLFHKTEEHGPFHIPPNEILRFSHQIPSSKMTGKEREGVPEGSFELDPASLPADGSGFVALSDVKKMNENIGTGVNTSCHNESYSEPVSLRRTETSAKACEKIESEVDKVKLQSPVRPNQCCKKQSRDNVSPLPNKGARSRDSEASLEKCNPETESNLNSSCQADETLEADKNHQVKDIQREISSLRRSPREFNCKKNGEVNVTNIQNKGDKHSGSSRDDNPTCLAQSNKRDASGQANDERHLDGNVGGPKSFIQTSTAHRSAASGSKVRMHNFNEGRCAHKFHPGQIWALYDDCSRLPKDYARVWKIETTPDLRLHVFMLECSSSPEDFNLPVSVGTFRVKTGRPRVLPHTAFSHQLKVESVETNRYKIYPRKREVWAIYKNWNANLMQSDQEKAEYEVVEVLEANDMVTEVSVLRRVNGFQSIYKAPRRQRSKVGILSIPHKEMARFSHQIPAIWHMHKDVRLREVWELDPLSIPGNVICLD